MESKLFFFMTLKWFSALDYFENFASVLHWSEFVTSAWPKLGFIVFCFAIGHHILSHSVIL